MAFINKLFLMLIQYIVAELELRVIDFKNGGFLPPNKRALQPIAQQKAGQLAERMARFGILEQDTLLKQKLLVLAHVLQN